MDRRTKVLIAVIALFAFLGITFLVTRVLVGAGAERSAVLRVLNAQAAGNADAVLADMPACRRSTVCSRVTRARVAKLKRPGTVQILNYVPSVQVTFGDRTGPARVAWRTDQRRFPVVQCVVVHREGPLTGGGVQLISISNPVGLESSCRN